MISTDALGGAEKRFLGLFLHVRRQRAWPLELVCPRGLADRARNTQELADVGRLGEGIHTFESGGGTIDRALVATVWRLARADPGAIFHFVLLPPQLGLRLHASRTLFTVPLSDLSLYNWRGRSMVYVGCALAHRTDFLDERVRDAVAERLPWLAGRFRVTPGSYVDLDLFAPAEDGVRDGSIAFSGTFTREKGIYRLAEQLPEIDARLKALGHTSVRYLFMGRDSDAPPMTPILRALHPRLDVSARLEPNPQRVLERASVFLSLQRQNNYPSKSLLEAMAAGCIPVVTDVGTTRKLVTEDVGFFVPRDFSVEDLVGACDAALSVAPAERARRIAAMRGLLRVRFSIEAMAQYYVRLYDELERSNASTHARFC